MRLRVRAAYRAFRVSYEPGQVIDLPDDDARLLLRDSADWFEVVVADGPPIADGPPVTGDIPVAPVRKARR